MVESYLYYQWDKATLAAGYSFSHEALFATFESVEEEVSSMFHLDVSKTAAPPDMGAYCLHCDPFLSISTNLIMVKKKLSLRAVGSAHETKRTTSAKQHEPTDIQFKGVFQRMKEANDRRFKKDKEYKWSIEDVDHFKHSCINYLQAIKEDHFEPKLSIAPLKHVVLEAKRLAVLIPDGVDDFLEEHPTRVQNKSTPDGRVSAPPAKKAKAGAGTSGSKITKHVSAVGHVAVPVVPERGPSGNPGKRRAQQRLVDDDEYSSTGTPLVLQSELDMLVEDMVTKREFNMMKTLYDVKLATAEAELKKVQEELKSFQDQFSVLSSAEDSTTTANAELTKTDDQMKNVMALFTSLVAVLASDRAPDNPILKAATGVMKTIATQIKSYNWPIERKMLVFEPLSDHQPFQDAVPEPTAQQQ